MPGPDADTVADLTRRIDAIEPKARRRLIAIAGPPGSGKTTLAAKLAEALGAKTTLVPMDGFHLDNRILDARGLRPRKGAPQTFDAAGFVHMIRRLASEDEVVIPVFDRARDIAIAGASVVGPETETAVVEGNYLLLDADPWRALRPLWDLSVFLKVSEDTLRARLIRRWLDHGLDPQAAEARATSNDLPNALHIARNSTEADIVL